MKRKVYQYVTTNKEKSSIVKAQDGFGYIIIPSDVPRKDYIRNVYLTGYCMILTTYQSPIRDVAVPVSMIQDLVFPIEAGDRGSLIRYGYYKDQPCLEAIHFNPRESYMYRENTYADERKYKGKTMSDIKALDAGNWLISFDDQESNNGKIIISAKGEGAGSTVEIGLDGNINVKCSDSIVTKSKNEITDISETRDIQATKSVTITVTGEENSSIVEVTGESVNIISKSINLGIDPTEPALLGDETKLQLQNTIDAVDTLITSIRSAPIIPTDGGASFKTALLSALTTYRKSNLDGILSENVKVK